MIGMERQRPGRKAKERRYRRSFLQWAWKRNRQGKGLRFCERATEISEAEA